MMKKRIYTALLIMAICFSTCLVNMGPSQATPVTLSAKVSFSDQTISLSWKEAKNVSTYYVYRAADWQEYESDLIATVKENSYVDETAFSTAKMYEETTKSYTYSILYKKNGEMQLLEERTVSFIPSKYSVEVEAHANCSQVYLEWDKASRCTAYRIYERNGSGKWKAIKNTSKTSYVVKNRRPNTTYQYMVRPYTNVGGKAVFRSKKDSSEVFTIKISTRKISTPKLNSASKSGKKYLLKWGAVSGATGYRVYKKTSDGWKKVTDTDSCSYSVAKGTYTVKAYVKYDGKVYWGGYNKSGIKTK